MNWTTIEWTNLTSNPIRGTKGNWHCSKVSPGCQNCYAETINRRWGGPEYKAGADTLRLDEKELDRLLKKQRVNRRPVAGKSVFLCDMTDLFQEGVSRDWIAAIVKVIRLRPDLVFQVLTKRPENVWHLGQPLFPWPNNLHLGVTVENSKTAARLKRLEQLKRDYKIPVAFASCEPLLSPLDLRADLHWLDWIIVGGESGASARPVHPYAVQSLRDQCAARKVPFFFKQWGEWAPVGSLFSTLLEPGDTVVKRDLTIWSVDDGKTGDPWIMRRLGKKDSGAALDGRHYKELPSVQFTIG